MTSTTTAEETPPQVSSEQGARVLVVDDEERVRATLAEGLADEGHDVITAGTGAECLAVLDRDAPDVILLDYRLPDVDGLRVLSEIHDRMPDAVVVMLTGQSSVDVAVRAMKAGAFHFLTKPLDIEQITSLVGRALETTRLRHEVRQLRRERLGESGLHHVIGQSPQIQRVKQLARKFAQSPASTILLTGESGTGKDLVARAIHAHSNRADGPFTNITCSALPENLLESELFGHEKGSFTGAHQQKKGLLELSHDGTVFLDEIGEMAPALQAKLLRFLESKTFRRVGGTLDLHPDVRIVAATNRELKEEVRRGTFREDLYYRLTVLHLHLPALRERSGDIPLLVNHFVTDFARNFHKQVRGVEPRTMERLCRYPWPGNVRELRNTVERAVLLAEGERLGDVDFELHGADTTTAQEPFELPAGGVDLEEVERSLLVQALRRTRGNQTRAGALLGINRDQVRYRIAKFDLDLQRFTDDA
jgi:DNA-binding NtrC family response regulator